MGKSSLIIVLGMSIIIAFFILRLNANSTESVAGTVNMFEKTHARLIANSGVEVYLEKFYNNRSMIEDAGEITKEFPIESLFNGTYKIYAFGSEEKLQVTSIAKFMGVTHTTIAEARFDPFKAYLSPGALVLSAETVEKDFNGSIPLGERNSRVASSGIVANIVIDGREHDLYGNLLVDEEGNIIGDAVLGIAVDEGNVEDAVEQTINIFSVAEVLGEMGEDDEDGTSVGTVDPDFNIGDDPNETWSSYAEQLAQNPDIIITPSNIRGTAPWGTRDNPKVTFINGEGELVKITQEAVYGTGPVSGCGILVINGDVEITTNFEFVGLVIAYKQAELTQNLTLDLAGTGTIIGSMVIAADYIYLETLNANFSILYSSQAINWVNSLLASQRWQILSWWE